MMVSKRKEYQRLYMRKYREQKRDKRQKLHDKLIEILGEKCIKCGFTDFRALQIDHVNGGGTQERKKFNGSTQYYEYLLALPNLDNYQVLCANCNRIKQFDEEQYSKPYME